MRYSAFGLTSLWLLIWVQPCFRLPLNWPDFDKMTLTVLGLFVPGTLMPRASSFGTRSRVWTEPFEVRISRVASMIALFAVGAALWVDTTTVGACPAMAAQARWLKK